MRRIGDILAGFEALPLTNAAQLLAGRRPLILAPHPDDESLGCGGLIAACTAAGIAPVVVVLTDGSASHPGSAMYPPPRLAALRRREVAQAVQILGLPTDCLHCLEHADTSLPRDGEIFAAAVADIATFATAEGCGVIIGPWQGDPHCDHEAGALIAAAAAAAAGIDLLSYPVWGWLAPPATELTEPRCGGWRLDIAAQLPAKRRAIAAHRSQYGGLIEDSPEGFQLPAALLAIFDRPYEVFIA